MGGSKHEDPCSSIVWHIMVWYAILWYSILSEGSGKQFLCDEPGSKLLERGVYRGVMGSLSKGALHREF